MIPDDCYQSYLKARIGSIVCTMQSVLSGVCAPTPLPTQQKPHSDHVNTLRERAEATTFSNLVAVMRLAWGYLLVVFWMQLLATVTEIRTWTTGCIWKASRAE
jgi:hypothetical protein